MKEVYDNYEYLKKLTKKRFADEVLADEAFSFAFEKLAQDDWRRVRAFQGKSSFRGYIGHVWCRLLQDFSNKKFGKVTSPQWIKNRGGVWEELFKLLCRQRLTKEESIAKIVAQGASDWNEETLEKAATEILYKIPNCGQKKGPAFSLDDQSNDSSANPFFPDNQPTPDEVVMDKERSIVLRALANEFLTSAENNPGVTWDEQKRMALAAAIRERLQISEEERLMLTLYFVDGLTITAVGKRLGLKTDQIQGKFRRLRAKIQKELPDLLAPFVSRHFGDL